MPVARERNVLPIHAPEVAVSWFVPPPPAHPDPEATAVAGHVVLMRSRCGELTPVADENRPPIAISPCGNASIVVT